MGVYRSYSLCLLVRVPARQPEPCSWKTSLMLWLDGSSCKRDLEGEGSIWLSGLRAGSPGLGGTGTGQMPLELQGPYSLEPSRLGHHARQDLGLTPGWAHLVPRRRASHRTLSAEASTCSRRGRGAAGQTRLCSEQSTRLRARDTDGLRVGAVLAGHTTL